MNGIGTISGVDVVLARDDQLRIAIDIRRDVYCSIGKLDLARVQDTYDEKAVHFLGKAGELYVSSARMVIDDIDFEMERYFDLSAFRSKGRCAEINRFAIVPSCRGKAVAYAMFRGFYRYALAKGIRYFCIVATPGQNSRMYREIGFVQTGGTVMYTELGHPHDAYILDLDAAVGQWGAERPRILEYFLEPIDGIG